MGATYTWDEIYNNALNSPFLSMELGAKDEARYQLSSLIMHETERNVSACECPEEEIENFLWEREKPVLFDERGNIVSS